jgi:hypothetical protein
MHRIYIKFNNHQEKKMKVNVGGPDKIIRIAVGAVIIAAGLFFGSWWGAVGLIPLATGLVNFCPAYVACGISTKKDK